MRFSGHHTLGRRAGRSRRAAARHASVVRRRRKRIRSSNPGPTGPSPLYRDFIGAALARQERSPQRQTFARRRAGPTPNHRRRSHPRRRANLPRALTSLPGATGFRARCVLRDQRCSSRAGPARWSCSVNGPTSSTRAASRSRRSKRRGHSCSMPMRPSTTRLAEAISEARGDVNGYNVRRMMYFCGHPLRMWRNEPLLRLFRHRSRDAESQSGSLRRRAFTRGMDQHGYGWRAWRHAVAFFLPLMWHRTG